MKKQYKSVLIYHPYSSEYGNKNHIPTVYEMVYLTNYFVKKNQLTHKTIFENIYEQYETFSTDQWATVAYIEIVDLINK